MEFLPLVWIGSWPEHGGGEPGQAWFADEHYPRSVLSVHYREHVAPVRPPIMVVLPDRRGGAVRWCIDSHPTDDAAAAWEVKVDLDSLVIGQRPLVTVSPSIRCRWVYHGFLADGVLSPDLNDDPAPQAG